MRLNKILQTISEYGRQKRIVRKATISLLILAFFSVIATYVAITQNSNPFGPDPKKVIGLILFDLVILLILSIIITRRIFRLWIARKRRGQPYQLQAKIILMFSLVASAPTIIVSIFSVLILNYGVNSWFNQKVSTALEESVYVAESYLQEHKENIRGDVLSIANDMNRQVYQLLKDKKFFNDFLTKQAMMRFLNEVLIFNKHHEVIAKSALSYSLVFELNKIPPEAFKKADMGEVVFFAYDDQDKVRALIKVNNLVDCYLLVGRVIDHKVLNHMLKTRGAFDEYSKLKDDLSEIQIKFLVVFVVISMLLLLAAIVIAIIFASAIVKPLDNLIFAAEAVKSGDLSMRVKRNENEKDLDEIGHLEQAFNEMTVRLEQQRDNLVIAYEEIDHKRHVSEMILSGVSAGIIAFDDNLKVEMINPSAAEILAIDKDESVGSNLLTIFSEITDLINKAKDLPDNKIEAEIEIERNGKRLNLFVRINDDLITFDNVTLLARAKREAAWSDVARRIAHEIKNPLTPIQLAAERIERKYSSEVSEPEIFKKYTETIKRHVSDIGKIVEEFVNFARLPTPIAQRVNISQLLSDATFSRECMENNIKYINKIDSDIFANADVNLISQVITNLFKNSEEAIEYSKKENGEILVELTAKDGSAELVFKDNGGGFPPQILDRITEPYITTKIKGSGLGLAIVKKIINDHNWQLQFENTVDNCALVRIRFKMLA